MLQHLPSEFSPCCFPCFHELFSTTLQRFIHDSSGLLHCLRPPSCSRGALLPPWQPSPGKLQAPQWLIMSGDILWHSFSLVSLVILPCVVHHQLRTPNCNLIFKFVGKGCSWVSLCFQSLGEWSDRESTLELFVRGRALQSPSQGTRFHVQGVA